MKRLTILPLFLSALVAARCAAADEEPKGGATSAFRTQAVRRGAIAENVAATGTLEPEEVVDVGAQVAGQVASFGPDPANPKKTIDYGSRVKEGTVLARLDDSLYKARRERARAHLVAAEAKLKLEEARLRLTEREREKVRKRVAERVATQDDLDDAVARCETARACAAVAAAGVEEARAALNEAELNLAHTTILSPVSGVVIDRRVSRGQVITAGPTAPSLFLIATDLKRLQVWASVNEANIASIRPGQQARFTVDAFPGRTFSGSVRLVRLNATLTRGVVTYTVVVSVDNAGGTLLPYLTANVQIQVAEHKGVLLVPNAALRWKPLPEQVAPGAGPASPAGPPGQAGTVWVEDKKGRVRPVPLRVGLTDGDVTEVLEGELAEGQPVIVGTAGGQK